VRGAAIAGLALILGCEATTGSLVVQISSSLEIPGETDQLIVRVFDRTTPLTEQSYTLGRAPRDVWPMVQQIVRGPKTPKRITVAAELRRRSSDDTLLLVGYAALEVELPETGERTIALEVERTCEDQDRDERGIGSGCRGQDCDDEDPSRPVPEPCGPSPDAGVVMDAGFPRLDAGLVRDAGFMRPDAGFCGPTQERCAPDEVCVRNYCRTRCMTSRECPDTRYTCNTQLGVCFCDFPCDNDDRCRPYVCEDGCCRI
jgi:hypothetical protein